MKARLAVLIVALAVGACSDEPPTAPAEKEMGGPQLIIATVEEVNDFLPMLEDLRDRVLPALGDTEVGDQLRVHTAHLIVAMRARNTEGARAAHDAALAVVQEYGVRGGADAFDAADIESVMLTLGTANEMIGQ
jgi:hypothetical protein